MSKNNRSTQKPSDIRSDLNPTRQTSHSQTYSKQAGLLFAVGVLYLVWLGWLLYVGLVNTQAGNQ